MVAEAMVAQAGVKCQEPLRGRQNKKRGEKVQGKLDQGSCPG